MPGRAICPVKFIARFRFPIYSVGNLARERGCAGRPADLASGLELNGQSTR